MVSEPCVSLPVLQPFNDAVEIKKKLVRDTRLDFERITVGAAKSILSKTKVVADNHLSLLRYSKETLEDCARQNEELCHDWRLVYVNGFSVSQLVDFFPHLFENSAGKIIGLSQEHSWFDLQLEKDYYLIDFSGKLGFLDWRSQQRELDKYAQVIGRCPDQVFCEALITIFRSSGEKLAREWSHWGMLRTANRTFIEIGPFGPNGICVNNSWWYNALPRRQVSLMRKFEI
ncbi:MAG: hypothetical protein NTZ49_01085 [Candidatus Parcubacteria bacterium]|nr:hypothetical protein [Candidatus Parcubacteria bacterium]